MAKRRKRKRKGGKKKVVKLTQDSQPDNLVLAPKLGAARDGMPRGQRDASTAVSYTHLTLPTTSRV